MLRVRPTTARSATGRAAEVITPVIPGRAERVARRHQEAAVTAPAQEARMTARKPDPVDTHVGSRVRLARRMANWSQEDLSSKLGLTFQQVQKYERGTNRVSASKLYAIAAALQRPVEWFFEGLGSADASQTPDPSHGLATRLLGRRKGLYLVEQLSNLNEPQFDALSAFLDTLTAPAIKFTGLDKIAEDDIDQEQEDDAYSLREKCADE